MFPDVLRPDSVLLDRCFPDFRPATELRLDTKNLPAQKLSKWSGHGEQIAGWWVRVIANWECWWARIFADFRVYITSNYILTFMTHHVLWFAHWKCKYKYFPLLAVLRVYLHNLLEFFFLLIFQFQSLIEFFFNSISVIC